jgi:triacylglycerol lipase
VLPQSPFTGFIAPIPDPAVARQRRRAALDAALTGPRSDADAVAAYLSAKAKLAYEEDETKIRTAIAEEGGEAFQVFRRGSSVGYGYTLAGQAWLAFRGTHQSREFLTTDLNLLPVGWPLCHCGFRRAWRRIRAQVFTWLEALPETSRHLWFTGHSLGGALALLAAYDAAQGFHVRGVTTFGAPRVGLFLFRHRYNGLASASSGSETPAPLATITRRYTHATDIVSRVPPPLPYCHVGTEYCLRDDGTIEEGRPPDLVERFLLWREGRQDNGAITVIGDPFIRAKTPKAPTDVTAQEIEHLAQADPNVLDIASLPPTVRLASVARPAEANVLATRVRSLPGVIPGLMPWWQLPRDERRQAAWSVMGSYLQVALGALALAPWIFLATLALAVARAVLKDAGEHHAEKYVAALARRYPDLASPTSLLPPAWDLVQTLARIRRAAATDSGTHSNSASS